MKRFWEKVEKIPFHECWEWTAGKDWDGYGLFRLSNPRIQKRAHRFSYELAHGPIPKGIMVCHKCDNPGCVRPEHLFLGSAKDNNLDCIRKGRQPSGPGEKNYSAKLNVMAVEQIRYWYNVYECSQREIAKAFGISQTQVSRIIRSESWK
jgi:hypothetical protein